MEGHASTDSQKFKGARRQGGRRRGGGGAGGRRGGAGTSPKAAPSADGPADASRRNGRAPAGREGDRRPRRRRRGKRRGHSKGSSGQDSVASDVIANAVEGHSVGHAPDAAAAREAASSSHRSDYGRSSDAKEAQSTGSVGRSAPTQLSSGEAAHGAAAAATPREMPAGSSDLVAGREAGGDHSSSGAATSVGAAAQEADAGALPAPATTPPLSAMWDYTHIRGVAWTGGWAPWTWRLRGNLLDWRLIIILAWAPWGLLLVWLRFLLMLWCGVFLALVPQWVSAPVFHAALPLLLPLAGIRTSSRTQDGSPSTLRSTATIIAANHCSGVDILPFLRLLRAHVLLDAPFYSANVLVRQFLGAVGAIPVSREAPQETRTAILRHLDSSQHPLVVFPEGWSNKNVGLLRFHRFMFSLGRPVVPCAIRARPLLPRFAVDILGSTAIRELLWVFFCPWTRFEIVELPSLERAHGEDATAFAERAQRAIAAEIGAVPTAYTKADALQWRVKLGQDAELWARVAAAGGAVDAGEAARAGQPEAQH